MTKIHSHGLTIISASVYFPPSCDLPMLLEDLRVSIQDLSLNHRHDIFIIAGDFNSRLSILGQLDPNIVIGTSLQEVRTSADQITNHRGRLLDEFMDSNGFILLNGRSRGDSPAQFTFANSNGQSTVDLIWVNSLSLHLIEDMWVDNIWSSSDHFPITVEIRSTVPQKPNNTPVNKEPSSLRWVASAKELYVSEMYHSLHATPDLTTWTTNEINNYLVNSIITAANNCRMIKLTSNKKNHYTSKPWFDAECRALKAVVNSSLKLCRNTPFDHSNWVNYQLKKSTYHKLLEKRKVAYTNSLQQKFANTRNASEFWSVIRSTRKQLVQPSTITLEDWENFYHSIYTPSPHSVHLSSCHSDDSLDAQITMDELLKSIAKCKTNKAAGPDGIPNEFFKEIPPNWFPVLLELFNITLDSGYPPESWSNVTMCLLHKKGDPKNPGNYRGIALMNCLTKIFTQIINERIKKWAEDNGLIPEEQSGFRTGRGCEDNVFTLQALLQIQSRFKNSSYVLFIDFKRAFDSIPHNKLWIKLEKLGLSRKIISLLMHLYENTHMKIKNAGKLSNPIRITEGVLQGEVLSPLLFNLYVSDISKFLKGRGAEGLFVDSHEVLLLMYADDIALLAATEVKLRRSLKILEEYCAVNGLTINTAKTKILIARPSGRLPRKRPKFNYYGVPIEIVRAFEYLGVTFSTSIQGKLAADNAAKKSKLAASSVLGILSKLKSGSWPGVSKLHSSMIRSTLSYLAHIWGLNPDLLEKLESANLFFFKRFLNVPICTPNYALRLELDLDHFALTALKAALSWVRKILEMPENRLPKICLLKLVSLTKTPYNSSRLNWIQQLADLLASIEEESILENLTASHWKLRTPEILDKFKKHHRYMDSERYRSSSACQFVFNLSSRHLSASHVILTSLPFHLARLLCQIRLASRYATHLSIGRHTLRLHPQKDCPSCGLEEPDSLTHLMTTCPALNGPRDEHLCDWRNQDTSNEISLIFLEQWSLDSLQKLFAYCKKCQKIRSAT